MLVVDEAVNAFPFMVNVQVIVAEGVGEAGASETAGMEGHFASSHDALAQAERQVCINWNADLQGKISIELQCHDFFRIKSPAQINMAGFLVPS